ncbi:MAG: aspartate/glutamate racemase family protein [Agathobacter sp.]|nr:aspartate/glutamate racemase family protein [Agathobacter sp.]
MRLGVIGGLGPMATAYFMELVIKMTKAECDQDHLEMIIYNCPTIPDRTKYILGQSEESPLPRMLEVGQALQQQGADVIAIPCMTAHYFRDALKENIGVRVIHGIRETAQCLKDAGVTTAGIMATDGTIQSEIFQKEIEALGLVAVIPDAEHQAKVMKMIYEEIKAGKMPSKDEFMKVKQHLIEGKGAQAVILGCTELSLIKNAYDLGNGVIDTLEVLAQASLVACEKEILKEYQTLVVPIK